MPERTNAERPSAPRAFTTCLLAAAAVATLAACSRDEPGAVAPGTIAPAAPAADTVEGLSGWLARYGESDAATVSLSPTAAFALEAGESIAPSVAPGRMIATYEGVLTIEEAGRYRFGAEVEGGAASLTIGSGPPAQLPPGEGARWGEWAEFEPGPVRISYTFTRAGDVDARLRPMWEMERVGYDGFVPEPIPSRLIGVPESASAEAAHAQAVMSGRLLLGELGCVNCHDAPHQAAIDRTAPDLSAVSQRTDGEWMLQWISDPQHVKPASGMPDVIPDSPKGSADAWTIVAYLQSLSEPVEWPAPATEETVLARGRDVYQSVGCLACHGSVEAEDNGSWTPPAPFGDLAGKWNVASLAAFLREPHTVRPAGRMPSLLLSDEESDAVAAYLARAWGSGEGAPLGATREQIAAGRQAFIARGCVSCHAVEGVEALVRAKALADLDTGAGCLDPADTATPRYALSSEQSAALTAAIAAVARWDHTAPAPLDHAAIALESLNCIACHEWHESGGLAPAVRDKFETLADVDLGDEGRIPPRLAGVGWKLTSAWLSQVIGEGARARPYMKARMPVFASDHAGALADELAKLDGVWPARDSGEPEVNDELVQGGLRLVGSDGFNCISCHVFGDAPPAGVPGPDIARFGERLRYDWWSRYIHDPARFKPLTRMPAFFAGGQTAQTAVLGGDPQRQLDAMWAYFSLGELFMPAPAGIPTTGGLALHVEGEPIVMRTFLKDVGARGIAIGFPAGVHFAYDAATSRLAYAWTGSFLDASGAWAGRGGSIVEGQGPKVWTAPPGPAVRLGDGTADAAWSFRGYSLDGAGVPTFLSELASGVQMMETLRPYPRDGVLFARTIELHGLAQGQTLVLHPGERSTLAAVTGASGEHRDGAITISAQGAKVTIELEVAQ